MKLEFEIEDEIYELPEYISIEQYSKVYKVKELFADDYFAAKLINILSNAPLDLLLQTEYSKIQFLSNYALLMFPTETPFIDRFEYEGVQYGFIPSWKQLSFAEWVDLDTLMSKKGDFLDYLHIITAILYRPIVSEKSKNNYTIEPYNADSLLDRAELFKKLDIKYFLSGQFFFATFAKRYTNHTPQYSLWKMIRMYWKNRKMINKHLLNNDGDGLPLSTELQTMILLNTKPSLKKSWWKFLTI